MGDYDWSVDWRDGKDITSRLFFQYSSPLWGSSLEITPPSDLRSFFLEGFRLTFFLAILSRRVPASKLFVVPLFLHSSLTPWNCWMFKAYHQNWKLFQVSVFQILRSYCTSSQDKKEQTYTYLDSTGSNHSGNISNRHPHWIIYCILLFFFQMGVLTPKGTTIIYRGRPYQLGDVPFPSFEIHTLELWPFQLRQPRQRTCMRAPSLPWNI